MTAINGNQGVTIQPKASPTQQARIVGMNEQQDIQKDMFLKLMLAQLKNQDPTSPMDQKDMMASMTQFSQVEQMQNMSKAMETLSLAQGVGLIGRDIEYSKVERNADGQVIGEMKFTGRVEHVEQGAGGMKLVLQKPEGATGDLPAVQISPSSVTKVFA